MNMASLFADGVCSSPIFGYPSFCADTYSGVIDACFAYIKSFYISLLFIGIGAAVLAYFAFGDK